MRPVIVRVLVTVSIVLALMASFSSHQYEYVGSVPRVHALGQKTATTHGAIIDSSESKFGGASAYFTPSTYVAVTDHPDFAFGTGDFTIDFWIKWKTLPDSSSGWSVNFYSQATDGQNYDLWQVNPLSAPTYTYQFYVNTPTGARPATNWQLSPGLSTGTWYHMAVVRSGDSWYLFQNGVQCGSTVTSSGSVPDYTGNVLISGFLSHGSLIDAWYDEFRISNVARWTSGFTPPTQAYTTDANTVLLLHFDSDFSDSSSSSTGSTSSGQGIEVGNRDTTYNRLHNGFLYSQKFTTAQFTGPLQSISFYAGENGQVSVALYSHDSGANAPLHPLTSRHTVTVTGVAYGAPKWVIVAMTGGDQIQISGYTVYWIVFDFDTNYGVCYSDTQSSGYRAWKDNWVYGTAYPDPWGTSTGTGAGYQGTVYFTYWASGTSTQTSTSQSCALGSLPATIYRGTKWDWVVNTADACADYQLHQADVQAMFAWPDVVAQWLVNKFGAPQYMSQRMTLELIAGSGIGAYSSPNGIGLTIGMFTIVNDGVKGGYAYQLIAHEMSNNYMTTAGGDYPPDWWADTVSPFPAATANLLEVDLNWGSSRAVGNAEVNSCHQSPPIDPIACPLINMFYDQLYGQYGTGMFANAFAAMRSDGIWFRDVGGQIKTISALRTNYVAAYLFIGANTDLSSILNGRVPNFDRQTTLDIKQARTNLQSLPRTDNRWNEYLHGNYAEIITTTTSSVSSSTTTTSSSMTTTSSATTAAISGIYGAIYWRDQYGNLRPLAWAQVSAVSQTGVTAVTFSVNGNYVLSVGPGTYNVTAASSPNFVSESKMATVSPGGMLLVDFELELTCTTCILTTTQSQSTTTAGTTATETSTFTSTTAGLQMQVVSNSTVTGLIFDSTRGILNFTIAGPQGTYGFFDATVAKTLLSGQPVVLIDGVQTSATVSGDMNLWHIHVTYPHSQHHVTIGGSNTLIITTATSSVSTSMTTTSSASASPVTTSTPSNLSVNFDKTTYFVADSVHITGDISTPSCTWTYTSAGGLAVAITIYDPDGLLMLNSTTNPSVAGYKEYAYDYFLPANAALGRYTVTVSSRYPCGGGLALGHGTFQVVATTIVTTPAANTAAPPPGPQCVIATAAYGSEMAPDVVYMRYVRDQLIGSTPAGRTLVAAFNAFYYSWSPTIAQTVAANNLLRALFRVLLLPIVGIVHAAAFMFTSVAGMTGSADAASIVAFQIAASLSVIVYIALPVLVATKLEQAIRRVLVKWQALIDR